MTMRRCRIAELAVLVALAFGQAHAQVPQYQQTPFSGLTGLQSMDVNTRQAAALALSKFRNNEGVRFFTSTCPATMRGWSTR